MIRFNNDEQTWELVDPSTEEWNFLIELGKQKFVENFSLAMFKQMMPKTEAEYDQMVALEQLDSIPTEELPRA